MIFKIYIILRYIAGTLDMKLVFEKRFEQLTLKGYINLDFASNKDQIKSITAYFFILGDNCITWNSQFQSIVTLSSTNAEYLAINEYAEECIWLKSILRELNFLQELSRIFTDSQSVLLLCKNLIYHKRFKNIEVKYHFIREKIACGVKQFYHMHCTNYRE